MPEVAISFGPDRHLAGTLAMPLSVAARPLGFIMLNAGVIHRIGPHRFNVRLARHLADCGWPSLRFDLAGQGDSDNAPRTQPLARQIIADLHAAMDCLGRTAGVDRFIIAGICSGAHHGLAAAQEDPRVAGLWMLDGHAYPTRLTGLQRRLLALRRSPSLALRQWVTWPWRRLVKRLRSRAAADSAHSAEEIDFGRNTPSRQEFADMLAAVDARGGRVFLMHSGGMLARYSYARQFHDVFGTQPFAARVRCDFLPDIDHTLSTRTAQERVVAAVAEWADGAFPIQDLASKQNPA